MRLGDALDPVYPAIEGLGPANLRRLIGLALDRLPDDGSAGTAAGELRWRDCSCRRCAMPC